MNGLRANPHDQQHCGCIVLPEALVGDVDPGWPNLRRHFVSNRQVEPVHYLRHVDLLASDPDLGMPI